MKTKNYLLYFVLLMGVMAYSAGLNGQCTDYAAPAGEPGFTTFNASYGGAPIVIAGCPQVHEITAFEAFASEAYVVDDIQMGSTYAFNLCNGPGAGAWMPDFTIVAPTGNVDDFGTDPDSCTITWTATETGTYQIIINEVDSCGGGSNTSTDGGYPSLTIITDEVCDTSICLTWASPNSASGYTNFNTAFGGAPCDDGSGCDTFSLSLEAWAAEAYAMDNIQEGGEYSFNICEGPGAGSWDPTFTIISPSGNVDASGKDEGSTCAVTWTASESGTYLIVINEVGACGGGANIETDNGIPAITCLGGMMCDTTMMSDTCLTWIEPSPTTGWTDFNGSGGAPCDDGSGCSTVEIDAFQVFASEAYSIDNFQEGGQYSFSMCNGPDAGSWVPDFTIIAPSGMVDAFGAGDGDGCTISWTASESGTYLIVINEAGFCGGGANIATGNGFPAISCTGGTMCDTTTMMMDSCVVGMVVSDLDPVVCGDTDSIVITIEGLVAPEGGGLGWNFTPGEGATGGLAGGFFLSNGNPNTVWNNDINGVMSGNGLDPLGGAWNIAPFTYANADSIAETVCEFAAESIDAFFNSNLTATASDIGGGQAAVVVEGGTAPYTFLWSDAAGQTSDTLDVEEDGEYNVVVTDAVGCTAEATVMVMSTSVFNLPGVDELTIAPNPTSGLLYVNLQMTKAEQVSVILFDVNGKRLDSRNLITGGTKLDFDMTSFAKGMYLLKVTVGESSTTRKVILTN